MLRQALAALSFSLSTDTYELEYVHSDANSGAAIDQAMYSAAGLALKLGHAEFNLVNIEVEGGEAQFSATRMPVDCGLTACAIRAKDFKTVYKSDAASELEVVVRLSFSAPKADASEAPAKYNAGRVMTMVENKGNTVQMASLLP